MYSGVLWIFTTHFFVHDTNRICTLSWRILITLSIRIFFLRKRLTAESSAVGANIGIVSKIIFSSIAIEVSVLIFQEDQIWQMLILSVEKASLVTIGLLVVNSL